MKGSKGYYNRARRLLKKAPREKGKPKLGKLLIEYAPGSQVNIKMDSFMALGISLKEQNGNRGDMIRAY